MRLFILIFFYCQLTLADSWQAETQPLELEIKAPFTENFKKAFVGVNDSQIPEPRDQSYFRGDLKLKNKRTWVAVKIKVRGQTSIAKAQFPKLTLKLVAENTPANFPFEIDEKFKIGTHMGEELGDKPKYQKHRLLNQKAPYREAFIYQLMKSLEIEGPRARAAIITWHDTSTINSLGRITRKAFILEHRKTMLKRLNLLEGPREEFVPALFITNLDLLAGSKIHLFQAIIGNWDFRLPLYYHNDPKWDRVHNIYILKGSEYGELPVPHDFDLASTVTGKLFSMRGMSKFNNQGTYLNHLMRFLIDKAQNEIPTELWAEVRKEFIDNEASVYELLEKSDMDDYGRNNIEEHFISFFRLLKNK